MKTVHCYGKIFRTHTEKGSAWTEALNPYEAKSIIFCGRMVARPRDLRNVKVVVHDESPAAARLNRRSYTQTLQPSRQPTATSIYGFRQFLRLNLVLPKVASQRSPDASAYEVPSQEETTIVIVDLGVCTSYVCHWENGPLRRGV
ncbi:hypothetical protein N7490_000033 [Penicillium lividum]|nr:hypothetical protein N7490_000033 [Penicillium lividum]